MWVWLVKMIFYDLFCLHIRVSLVCLWFWNLNPNKSYFLIAMQLQWRRMSNVGNGLIRGFLQHIRCIFILSIWNNTICSSSKYYFQQISCFFMSYIIGVAIAFAEKVRWCKKVTQFFVVICTYFFWRRFCCLLEAIGTSQLTMRSIDAWLTVFRQINHWETGFYVPSFQNETIGMS